MILHLWLSGSPSSPQPRSLASAPCQCQDANPALWLPMPFSKGTCHAPAHTHTHWHSSCLTRSRPPELIQLLFTVLGQGKPGLDQTDTLGAEGSFGMHVFFQPKNGSHPTFPSQHQPFPFSISRLPGAITAHFPSPRGHRPHSSAGPESR